MIFSSSFPIPGGSLDLPSVSVHVSFFDRSDIFGPAPALTSSCSQAHRDLLFPYSPVVKSFSPISVPPVIFPLFSHLMSRFTCLDSCFCSLANDHLYLIARDLSSQCEWKFFALFIDHCCRLRRDFNGIVSCCRLRFAFCSPPLLLCCPFLLS